MAFDWREAAARWSGLSRPARAVWIALVLTGVALVWIRSGASGREAEIVGDVATGFLGVWLGLGLTVWFETSRTRALCLLSAAGVGLILVGLAVVTEQGAPWLPPLLEVRLGTAIAFGAGFVGGAAGYAVTLISFGAGGESRTAGD